MTRRDEGPLGLLIPSLAEGGAERVAVNVLRAIQPTSGHFLLFEDRVAYDHDGEIRVVGAGNFLHGAEVGRRVRQVVRAGFDVHAAKRGLALRSCLSFTTWPNVLNVLAPGSARVVLSVHNHESTAVRGRSAPLVRALIRWCYRRADAIVAVSAAVANDLHVNFGVPREQITIIHNALDLASIEESLAQPLSPELDAWMCDPVIVTTGRLVEQKGQWHLLRAIARIRETGRPVRLVVLGARGPLESWLLSVAVDLGLRTHVAWDTASAPLADADVAFLGFLRNPFAIMARATVFAFPSLWEGFGNALLEAMACGVPVLSSDCEAGPREILEGAERTASLDRPERAPWGLLLPTPRGGKVPAKAPLDWTEVVWADELAALLDDPARRAAMRVAGRARARAFGLEASAAQWRQVLFQEEIP